MKANSILLICGPSGCGKSYITKKLLEDYSNLFYKLPQYTTRERRINEKNDEYYFIDKDHYDIIKDSLVAKTTVGDAFYGTVPIAKKDKIGIIIVNTKGAKDFLNYAGESIVDYNFFLLEIDSDIPTSREKRDVEAEREEIRSNLFIDSVLKNTKEKYLTTDDVLKELFFKNFISKEDYANA